MIQDPCQSFWDIAMQAGVIIKLEAGHVSNGI